MKARELADEVEKGVVVWIHAPQPFEFSNSSDYGKQLTRSSKRNPVYSFVVGEGGGKIESQLYELNILGKTVSTGSLEKDIARLMSNFGQSSRHFELVRTIEDSSSGTVDKTVTKHLARLWARQEIERILESGADEKPAIELATKYQLVTPVTGAVVLETKEQYDRAGLKPVEKNVVHAVPELETYLMMIIGLAIVFWVIRRHG